MSWADWKQPPLVQKRWQGGSVRSFRSLNRHIVFKRLNLFVDGAMFTK